MEKRKKINEANENELASLDGIGPEIAKRVIEYRRNHGEIKDWSDLNKIIRLGEHDLENLKEKTDL